MYVLYILIYIYVYICVRACVFVCIYIHTIQLFIHGFVHLSIFVCSLNKNMHMYRHDKACHNVNVLLKVCIYIYNYMRVCPM